MTLALLLSTQYSRRPIGRSAPLDKLVKAHLDNSPLERPIVESALSSDSLSPSLDPFSLLEKWRELTALLLLLRLRGRLSDFHPSIFKYMRALRSHTIWPEFQLLGLYQAVCAYLVGAQDDFPSITQLPNGACPLDGTGIWPWGEVPQPALHAEMGVVLALYATLSQDATALEHAVKLAEWQKNSLDYHYDAFDGLFALEGHAAENALLVNNAILFDAVAKLAYRQDMAAIAAKLRQRLSSHDLAVAAPAVILSMVFAGSELPVEGVLEVLPAAIQDPHFAMAGCRSDLCSVVGTLFGGGSGMGCFHGGDNKVVSYGPQHLPLGECCGYGLEGGSRLLGGQVKRLESSADSFLVEGISRMAPTGAKGRFSLAQPGGIWIETRQEYKDGVLDIEARFEGLEPLGPLAFSFFVKSGNCKIGSERSVRPRSLNRYLGASAELVFEGGESVLGLVAGQEHDEMHVVPLSGGANFWGADFLVSYLLPASRQHFSWKITLS